MKNHIKKPLATVIGLASLCALPSAFAGDISYELRHDKKVENYFELGLGAYSYSAPSRTERDGNESGIYAVINGYYNWNGFFIDVYNESSDPVMVGYDAWENENWSFDVTLGLNNFGFDASDDVRYIGLDERETDVMLGGRVTGRFGDSMVQFHAKRDISGNHQGHIFTAQYGRNWQYKDMNFHGIVGAQYADSALTDYYHGISAEEAQRTFYDAYDTGASLNLWAEVGVTYPITESWQLRATARYVDVDDAVINSPLFLDDSNKVSAITTSVSYTF